MSAPNRRHSEPRKIHMPSFELETPVLVWVDSPGNGSWWSSSTNSSSGASVVSDNGSLQRFDGGRARWAAMPMTVAVHEVLVVGRLERPTVDADEQDEPADRGHHEAEDH